jgi:hypothetical protein
VSFSKKSPTFFTPSALAEIAGYAGLFGNYEGFRHEAAGLLEFDELLAGQLFHQPFHFEGEQSRRHPWGWQEAFCHDVIEGRFRSSRSAARTVCSSSDRVVALGEAWLFSRVREEGWKSSRISAALVMSLAPCWMRRLEPAEVGPSIGPGTA